MAKPKAESSQLISVDVGGIKYDGHVVISGTRKLQFVVHYAGRSEGDGRDWGTSNEERNAMMTMAKAMLIQMLAEVHRMNHLRGDAKKGVG